MFIGIGAQKAGTSWLSDYLKSHPEVFHSPVKELNFFNKLLDNPLNNDDANFRLRRIETILLYLPDWPINSNRIQRLLDIAATGKIGTDERAYFDYFASRIGNERIFGEISPSYSHLGVEGYKKMAAAHSDMRIIFLLRDPVERTCSSIRHTWRVPLTLSLGGNPCDH